jgi:hypothetical protein
MTNEGCLASGLRFLRLNQKPTTTLHRNRILRNQISDLSLISFDAVGTRILTTTQHGHIRPKVPRNRKMVKHRTLIGDRDNVLPLKRTVIASRFNLKNAPRCVRGSDGLGVLIG